MNHKRLHITVLTFCWFVYLEHSNLPKFQNIPWNKKG